MRKSVPVILLALAQSLSFAQEAQQPAAGAAAPAEAAEATPPSFVVESEHYLVTADGSADQAADASRRMESILALANDVFHFDLAELSAKMQVRMYLDEASFNDALKDLGEQPQDFVLLSYPDSPKTELLCYPRDEPSFSSSLIHQGVVQFARTFVPGIPLWMREGIAATLEASAWNPKTAAYRYRPNLTWLGELKAMLGGQGGASLVPYAELLSYTRDDAKAHLEAFYPQAWGLVYSLRTSPDIAHNRVLWEAICALRPPASLEENVQAVGRAFQWIETGKLTRELTAYVMSLKDAPELVAEASELYQKGDLATAEEDFLAASRLEPESSAIPYYLGLIAYARKDYPAAQARYQQALELGAQAGLVNYALGVNAFAAGNLAASAAYLASARKAEPQALGGKVDALLKRLEATR